MSIPWYRYFARSRPVKEGQVAAYIKDKVKDLGLKVFEDRAGKELGSDTGNLIISSSKGRGEPLFLSSHMDTVQVCLDKEVPVLISRDRIDTGGVSILGSDDKVGIAAALEMLTVAVEKPEIARPLDLIFTIKEERGALGSGFLNPEHIQSRYGFNLDGETPVYSAIREAPAKARYNILIHGKSAHAALNPEEGINAVRIAGKIINKLPDGRIDSMSVANTAYVAGGGATNVVPDRAEINGEFRSLDKLKFTKIKENILNTVASGAESDGGQAEIAIMELYKGYYLNDDEICVSLFSEACKSIGKKPLLLRSLGGGDSNQFNNKGMRNLVFGFGMESIHSKDEYIVISRVIEAAALLERTIFFV
ncbi:MAG TPA: M20/M25/M40 family metallo-hydrolase [Spirochaetales bacterium]|nr:M20/M25/M40 family metallo-hydrolase [Spirochaetales bacterium]